ncbi:CPBP family intramembrane metalloprotease [Dyadobacter sp. CY345]|uniref:CPBP family intramembrane glutamic endopeptidase n=1 Tax=Dyadobacter sp. CY345 TaxID=2909335 RepID=UPI001F1CBE16|nr:CPBP family intramembrane glutamic endopeptidase [Dyadobacter sp. CY345]MCF2447673.1 CPBP family intramembrane metalloprotease [Dyadobacter sp. CY345]
MGDELKPFFKRFFDFNWKFGLFLVLLICVSRFILVLQANATGNYGFIGLIMAASAAAPFLFLSRSGRRKIGILITKKYRSLFIAAIAGLTASILLHYLGQIFHGNSYENWYVYIGKSYKIPAEIDERGKAILFTIMAITGMTFSPIGEELFFRGIVHASFAKSIGDTKASFVDSAAFAITHISHFGLIFLDGQWTLLKMPALIWVLSMFLVSIMFFLFKKHSESILGAIICHAAFNLGMIYSIFYLL